MTAAQRHNVSFRGDPAGRTLVLAHGFGCDQAMWIPVAERLPGFRSVLYDLAGFGQSDLGAYDPARYVELDGHAEDLIELCRELELDSPVFVGHSVSAMIGVIASLRDPDLFSSLILVGPSPCYIDDGDYQGGFQRSDIDEMLESLDLDFFAWSAVMAPIIAGNADRPEYGEQLAASFCRSDLDAAKQLARATFLSDNRADLPHVEPPTLVLQCDQDPIAPSVVGHYVNDRIPNSQIVELDARGHCPNLTAPDETADAIRSFLGG